MIGFLRKICEGRGDEESHRYFIRFGKGNYRGRFLVSAAKGKRLKLKASFELANDFVSIAKEIGARKFSGRVLSKESVEGLERRKKAGVFVYEVNESDLSEFSNAYYYLVDCETPELNLRIKKALPKPGRDAEKVDDSFCLMEADLKFWELIRDAFFWDAPDGKKIKIEHELNFNEIILPNEEKDNVEIRESALRKGVIVRKGEIDGKEFEKRYDVEA